MKKTIIATLLLPASLLSSCNFLSSKETVEKEIQVYDLDNIANNGDVSDGYQSTVIARFIEGEDYVPYVRLEDYFSFYKPHFKESVDSEVEVVGNSIAWTVREGKDYHFVAEFNMAYRAVAIAGSLDSAYREDDNQRDLEALYYAMQSDYTAESSGSGYSSYYFTSIDCFKYEDDWYLPLGFLNILLSDDTGIYYFYNYAHIYSTKDVENYAAVSFKENGNSYTVDSQMAASKKDSTMPEYLRKHNLSLFIFLMNNFYGLKEYKDAPSMTVYYKKVGLYSKFTSADASIRAQAYADALDIFDDNHTALVSTNDTWGEHLFVRRRLSKGIASRAQLKTTLVTTRNRYYSSISADPGKSIVYSQDGKTAMYMFDGFNFTSSDVLNGDDLERLYEEDTFIGLIHALDEIKNKGGVENVVLDLSTNGGGTVGVMLKILALLSKDNVAKLTYFEGMTSQVISATCNVDTNQDEKYDALDCYGNDFKFYILVSDCSYSAGNALPCIAKLSNIAKIIGQKSGGGECAVSIHYLPNSQYVYHSSNMHLGYYDGNTGEFAGFEGGATPDIEIKNTDDFYDIEKLNNMIVSA